MAGSAPTSLRIRLLGGLAVDDVPERDLGSRKARTLLKALALARGSSVPTDRLVDLLWGDSPPARPSEQVGVLVSRLRGVLGAERLPRTSAGYAVVADWLDVDELAARVDEAAAAVAAGRLAAARATATAALALARGPLLVDEDGDWVDAERAAVEAIVGRARRLLAEAAAGDHDAATVAAEAALAHDPYDEVALQILMRAHAGAGRPASALAAYARARVRLAEDLGVSPTAATEALHDEILLGRERTGDGATAEPGAPTIVGRRPELAALEAALRAVAAGGTRLVVVEGEPGIGKTALVAAFAGLAAAGGAVVLRGHCDELGSRPARSSPSSTPSRPTGRGRSATTCASLLSGDAAGRPSPTPSWDAPGCSMPSWAPCSTPVADGPWSSRSTTSTSPTGRRSPGWPSPVAEPHRLLVVATRRPGHARVPDADVVTLGPLAPDEVAELVGDERAVEIYERSGGNPLFATALALRRARRAARQRPRRGRCGGRRPRGGRIARPIGGGAGRGDRPRPARRGAATSGGRSARAAGGGRRGRAARRARQRVRLPPRPRPGGARPSRPDRPAAASSTARPPAGWRRGRSSTRSPSPCTPASAATTPSPPPRSSTPPRPPPPVSTSTTAETHLDTSLEPPGDGGGPHGPRPSPHRAAAPRRSGRGGGARHRPRRRAVGAGGGRLGGLLPAPLRRGARPGRRRGRPRGRRRHRPGELPGPGGTGAPRVGDCGPPTSA